MSMKIIIVDDDPGDRNLILIAIKKLQKRLPESYILPFSNAKNAFEEIKKNKVALLIVDMDLKDDGGIQGGLVLLDKVNNELKREYPAIVISGSKEETLLSNELDIEERGDVNFWEKSDRWDELTILAFKILKTTRLETRVKNLEDSNKDLHTKIDKLTESLTSLTNHVKKYTHSEGQAWVKAITSLIPKKITDMIRKLTGIQEYKK